MPLGIGPTMGEWLPATAQPAVLRPGALRAAGRLGAAPLAGAAFFAAGLPTTKVVTLAVLRAGALAATLGALSDTLPTSLLDDVAETVFLAVGVAFLVAGAGGVTLEAARFLAGALATGVSTTVAVFLVAGLPDLAGAAFDTAALLVGVLVATVLVGATFDGASVFFTSAPCFR